MMNLIASAPSYGGFGAKATVARDRSCRRDQYLFFSLAATAVMNLLDGLFTIYWIRMGLAVEANPIMNLLLSHGEIIFLLGKVGAVSTGIFILWRYRDRKLATIGNIISCTVYGLTMIWHCYGLFTQ